MSVEPLRNRLVETGAVRPRVAALVDAGMAISQIAVEAGVRRNELQSWVDSHAPAEKLEQRVAAWLEEVARAITEQGEPEAVDTEAGAQINQALEFARSTPTISLIYGAAGMGKTIALTRYLKHHNEARSRDEARSEGEVYYVAASRWNRSPSAILEKIAGTMGAGSRHAYRTDALAEAILYQLRRGALLIVDEAQHLDTDALDGLRYFHDEGRIGIAYCGNLEVYNRIAGKGRRATFAQLSSRIGMRVHLAAPKETDVDAILEAWGVAGRLEREYGQQIARGPGGLRQLVQVLRQARIIARGMKGPVNQRIMRAAAAALGLHE